ncbi:MAG: glycosyltransferase [Acidimicrobiales bacterium]
MRRLFRRFVAVGIVATVVDIGGYILLHEGFGWSIVAAEVVALPTAALTSWLLHRFVTLRDDPYQRWMNQPGLFVGVSAVAGLIDLAVLLALGGSALAKVIAVAVASVVRFAVHRMLLFRDVRAAQQTPAGRPLPEGDIRLSVVVPAYREADRIESTVDTLRAGLGGIGSVEIVVVDDGSDDDTASRAAGADQVVVLPDNQGKGAAVRAGMLEAQGRVCAFVDADLAYGPDVVDALARAVEEGWDIAVGNRRHVATHTLVRAGRLREVGGRLVNLATQALLLGQYRDTQCGVKAMRRDVARSLFARTTIDGFAFDIELFHLVERDRLTLVEVPVTVTNSSRSTVHIVRDTGRLFRDLWRIRVASRTGVYDRTP